MTDLIWCRHARTPLNAAGLLRGHLDPALDDVGLQEAALLAGCLAAAKPSRVLSSPLQRARQTAEAIAAVTGAPVLPDERLIDRDYGPWAGHGLAEVLAQVTDLDSADGIEPARAVLARALALLLDLASGPAQTLVLVSHDAVNRTLLSALAPSLGSPEEIGQRTACWNLLRLEGARWQVELVDQRAPYLVADDVRPGAVS